MDLDRSRETLLIEHMTAMLKTHASLGRIIADASDESRLLHDVCTALVANQGYDKAWIVLFDQERMATDWAQSGLEDEFAALIERFRQCRFTRCVIEALESPLPLIYAEPFSECGDCPLARKYEGFSAISIRLYAGREVFGVLTVGIPRDLVTETQERELFADLAESISQGIRRLRQNETVRRQTARLLQYERIISRAGDLMSIVDGQYRYIVVNDAYEREFGKLRREIEGHTIAHLLGEEHFRTQIQPRLDEAFAGREVCFDHVYPGKDEAIHRRVQYRPVLNQSGDVTQVVITAHDITDRKRGENALLAAAACLDVLSGDSPMNERLAVVTRTLQEITGISRTHVFRNENDPTDGLCMSQLHESCAPGIASHLDDPRLQRLPYSKASPLFLASLQAGRPFAWIVKDMPEEDRGLLEEQGIVSLLVLPVFCGDSWWGFLGMDNCATARMWREDEISLLEMVSRAVGLALLRARSEQALLDKQEELDRYFTSSLDLLCIANSHGEFVRLNPQWEEVLGYPLEELVGRKFMELVHPDDRERTQRIVSLLGQQKAVFNFENRYLCKNGTYRWIEWRSKPLGDLIYAAARDITVRKNAERELRQANMRLQSIIDVMPGSLSVMDSEYRVVNANRYKAQSIFGETTDGMEIFGRKCFSLFQNRDVPCPWCRMEEVLSTGNSVFEVTRPDDPREIVTGRAFQVYLNPIKDEDGKIVGVVEYGLDITELRSAKEQALAANQAKSEFLANMSHELRTPLNGIMGMLQLLGLTGLNAEQEDYALTGLQSCERLIRLLTDILDLSRIESGKMNIQNEPLELHLVLEQLEALFTPVIRQDGISFRLEIDSDIPLRLLGDAARLQQVLINMLGNAFKFSHGGSVRLQASLLPPSREAERTVLFSIADTGIGIPNDKLDNLFKPFSQISQGYTRSYQGAGLGLSICKRLVELMGGNISVESEEGVGTTMHFTATFGIAPPSQTGTLQIDAPQGRIPEGLKILVVEDDHVSSVSVAMILAKLKTRPTRVEDGRKALAALRREKFDLVLMDVQMPVMDGVETTQAIRAGLAGEESRSIPIVALTAYAMVGDRDNFLQAGMDDYLAKPVSVADLERILLKHSRI
ncbi:MAG: PAS domain S-box protein [Proteobacteria bacterium]|nr:PAS domain S-box protein [Pseudomonadota bacterium]